MNYVDFHIHSGPSLLPRRYDDHELESVLGGVGIKTYVLKAHEGTTAERAKLAGGGAVGSIVLNSTVGGANADAVSVAAAFGARVVWLPTISSEAHQAARQSSELSVHSDLKFRRVPVVTSDMTMLPEWDDVFDEVASNDMVLASGHVTIDEAIVAFKRAQQRGVRRLLVSHPLMPFLNCREEHLDELKALSAYLEIGVLADHTTVVDGQSPTAYLAERYPHSLLVFGSDLGHTAFPEMSAGIRAWLAETEELIGLEALEQIGATNGKELLTS